MVNKMRKKNIYQDMIEFNQNFQKSINLEFDLENKEKINSYISTASTKQIEDWYLENIRKNQNHASILVGPYGKGKSHLLLHFLHQSQFLPVVINAGIGDLSRALLYSLRQTLKRFHLQDLLPDTYYSEAIKTIQNWKQEFPQVYEEFDTLLMEDKLSADRIMKRLKKYDERALKHFMDLYPQITAGSVFSPMVQMDVILLYREVNHALIEKTKYRGMFLVFDEFSKYIEGHKKEGFAADMHVLQNLCELCNKSNPQEQMFLTLVAHKSIKNYGNKLDKSIQDAFRGVEGRLTEKEFVVSSRNSYELIGKAIPKKKSVYKKLLQEHLDFKLLQEQIWKESYEFPLFSSHFFREEDFKNIVAEECFPLTPVAAAILLNISERIGQNERTVFTFLSGDEKGCLKQIIQTDTQEPEFVGADKIYDYFEIIFREDISNELFHQEWLKADYALQKLQQEQGEEKRKADATAVIKTLSLIRMVHREEELPAQKIAIEIATGLSKERTNQAIDFLEKCKLLAYKKKSDTYLFKNNIGIDLDEKIEDIRKEKFRNLSVESKLLELMNHPYVLPKMYNQMYCMTRYFEYCFMKKEDFLKLNDTKSLFEENFSDGKLIVLTNTENQTDISGCLEKLTECGDERIVVLYPKKSFAETELVQRFFAVRQLMKDEEFTEQNQVLIQELLIYEDEILYEINEWLEELVEVDDSKEVLYFETENKIFVNRILESNQELNRCLSNLCFFYYPNAPKINNELINKNEITSQIKKARKKIVGELLEGKECFDYFQGTSSEATIFRATLFHTGAISKGHTKIEPFMNNQESGIYEIYSLIREFLHQCVGKKVSFQVLYEKLQGKGFGIRKGSMPIYLADELMRLDETPIIYLDQIETSISADTLERLNETPERYSLYIEMVAGEKRFYLEQMEEIFEGSVSNFQKGERFTQLVKSMQSWYRTLPQFTATFSEKSIQQFELKGISKKEVVKFQKILRPQELNARDVLFEKIPKIFDTYQVSDQIKKIKQLKDCMDDFIEVVFEKTIQKTIQIFHGEEGEHLKSVLKGWLEAQSSFALQTVYDANINAMLQYLEEFDSYDAKNTMEVLSKIMLGLYVENWNDDSFEKLIFLLEQAVEKVEAVTKNSKHNTISNAKQNEKADDTNQEFINDEKKTVEIESGMRHIAFTGQNGEVISRYIPKEEEGNSFMENALESVMDEFGDAVDDSEKVLSLMTILEKILKKQGSEGK